MFFFIPGIKVALLITGAIGVGAAVFNHWEDIKIIVENLDEIRKGCADTIEQILEKGKSGADSHVAIELEEKFNDEGGFGSDTEVEDGPGSHATSEPDSDANPDHSSDSSTAPTPEIGYSSSYDETPDNATIRRRTEPTPDPLQPSMPSPRNFEGLETSSDSGIEVEHELAGMSDFSIISSDDEFR